MLISEFLKIKVNSQDIQHLESKGYFGFKINDDVLIKIKDLKKNSSRKVKCKCQICNSINEITYQKYNLNIERGGIYTCKHCNNYHFKKTCLKKYGVDNPLKNDKIKDKVKETCLKKYGTENINKLEFVNKKKIETFLKNYNVSHPMKDHKIKEKCNNARIKSGYVKSYNVNKECNDYKKRVINLTFKNRKNVFEQWDGYDFYDNEYIKDNLNLNHFDNRYPTIDHKISIKYGFENKIPPEELAELNNLCITKQIINKRKSFRTHFEFNCQSY